MEPNYHGYTESEEKKAERASRRNWEHSVASLGLPSITEAEVDEFLFLMEKTKRADHIAVADPRTDDEIALDQWQAETEATRMSDYPI